MLPREHEEPRKDKKISRMIIKPQSGDGGAPSRNPQGLLHDPDFLLSGLFVLVYVQVVLCG